MISQIKSVFPEEQAQALYKLTKNSPWRYGWASNKNIEFTHWNHDFTLAPVENGLDVSHELHEELQSAWQYLQDQYLGPQTLLRCYTNSHTYGVEGYPHTDSRRRQDMTLVTYMTPDWQRAWGGETVVYDGDTIIHAELPKFNSALIFPGASYHQARSVTRICPAQRITLMFKFAPVNTDLQRDKLQVFLTALGVNKIKHGSGSLMGHLLRVYDILRANNYSTTIASAGALHSIFGTNAFKHQTLVRDQRDLVQHVAGELVLELVELFSELDRPHCLESALRDKTLLVQTRQGTTKSLTENQLNSITAIEAANLMDQKSLKKYPLLAERLNKD